MKFGIIAAASLVSSSLAAPVMNSATTLAQAIARTTNNSPMSEVDESQLKNPAKKRTDNLTESEGRDNTLKRSVEELDNRDWLTDFLMVVSPENTLIIPPITRDGDIDSTRYGLAAGSVTGGYAMGGKSEEDTDSLGKRNTGLSILVDAIYGEYLRGLEARGEGAGRFLDKNANPAKKRDSFDDFLDEDPKDSKDTDGIEIRGWLDDFLHNAQISNPSVILLITHGGDFLKDTFKVLDQIGIDEEDDDSEILKKIEPLATALTTHVKHFLVEVPKALKTFHGLDKRAGWAGTIVEVRYIQYLIDQYLAAQKNAPADGLDKRNG